MEDIVYKKNYLSADLVEEIENFYSKINDARSGGPKSYESANSSSLGKEGAWDIPLRLELPKNPVNKVIDKLKKDFGQIIIHTSSIRLLGYPFAPHSDIRSSKWLLDSRENYKTGFTFLIPLSWQKGYKPGTAFFSSPPIDGEPLYIEHADVLPKFQKESVAKNFSVKKLIEWNNPGDLIAWKNYMYHCSMTDKDFNYSDNEYCKKFISIETFLPKSEIVGVPLLGPF